MLGLGKGLVVGMVVGLLAGGCGGDDDATPPTTRQVTTTVDPFAVPDPIDVAYVERVMTALDHLYGDAAREVARERALTDEFEAIMRSIYADESLELTLQLWARERDRSFENLAASPKDVETTVIELLMRDRDCVVAAVNRDFSPLLARELPPPGRQEYIVLRKLSASANGGKGNPTSWSIVFDGFREDDTPPTDRCDAR